MIRKLETYYIRYVKSGDVLRKESKELVRKTTWWFLLLPVFIETKVMEREL